MGAAKAVAASSSDLRTVGEVRAVPAPATSQPHRSHEAATSQQAIWAQRADWVFRAFHSLVCSGDNRLSFWLFPVFHAKKTGGSVPDPERPDGSSPALPTEFQEGRTLPAA